MCCCDSKNETLGLLDPIYAGTGIINPPGTASGNYWDWSDPPPRHDGGGSIGNGTPLPPVAMQTATPVMIANAAQEPTMPAASEGVDTTTVLIVIGILGAVFMATR